jgi:LysM repeat protein
MYRCPNGTFPYSIQPGDTLWKLAKSYNTTVEALVSTNPGIDPMRLPVGHVICIRPGRGISRAELELRNTLRLLWEQHVAWTRMVIISMASDLEDVDLVTRRLLRNPTDFEAVLRPLYGDAKSRRFADLLTEHLVIAAELVMAAKKGDSRAAADAERRWYDNANEIAAFLQSINPFWSRAEFMDMLHEHLALTKSEAVSRLNKDFSADIALYDEIEKQALMMADAMANGIVRQFPARFLR